jgi:hypothetical protein
MLEAHNITKNMEAQGVAKDVAKEAAKEAAQLQAHAATHAAAVWSGVAPFKREKAKETPCLEEFMAYVGGTRP